MKEYLIEIAMLLVIVFLGMLISTFCAPLFTTDKVEYAAICLAIIFHGALVYIALKRKR